MKKFINGVVAIAAVTAIGALGCERRDDRDIDNDMRRTGDRLEDSADRTGDRIEDKFDRAGDRLEQAGKDMTAGVSYEVAKIDKEANTVELRRTNNLPGVTDKKDLQSGKDSIVLTFTELANKVEGDKAGNEIADELHVGENVNVFMDATHNITKITY